MPYSSFDTGYDVKFVFYGKTISHLKSVCRSFEGQKHALRKIVNSFLVSASARQKESARKR